MKPGKQREGIGDGKEPGKPDTPWGTLTNRF